MATSRKCGGLFKTNYQSKNIKMSGKKEVEQLMKKIDVLETIEKQIGSYRLASAKSKQAGDKAEQKYCKGIVDGLSFCKKLIEENI